MSKQAYLNLLIIALIVLNLLQWQRWREAIHRDEIIYSDTVTYYDTMRVVQPVVRDSVVIKYVTQRLPVIVPIVDTTKADEPIISPTINDDSVEVQIPITQKKYEGKGYKAYVSGYNPMLDSITMYPEKKLVYIKPSRWSVGMQAGVGISREGKVAPYIGVGVSYRLFGLKGKNK